MSGSIEHRAKKRWGQHFLLQPSIARRMVDLLQPHFNTIVEIGPGTGALTRWLWERYGSQVQLVEIDPDLSNRLQERYPAFSDCIHTADFIDFSLAKYPPPTTLIGNLPYNVSSQILFKTLKNKDIINQAVFMVQKEVADRINAGPFSKKYGILSVLVQLFFSTSVAFEVGKMNFVPIPNVTSAVLTLARNNRTLPESVEKMLFSVVKQAFNQRRKILRNSLKACLPHIGTKPWFASFANKRPEQLHVEDFAKLAGYICSVEDK